MAESKHPKAIIFSQGDEIINGAVVDTNTAWIAEQCHEMGFDIVQHITVPDDYAGLVSTLENINNTADMCICTGGLGPTEDDLTAQAYAEAFNAPLILNEEALTEVQAFFIKLDIDMSDVNRKQAYLPKGTDKIQNQWGTAPGFVGQANRCRFYFLPGVPYEMKNMVSSYVLNDLQNNFAFASTTLITLRTVGIGESDLQQHVDQLTLPSELRIGFKAGLAENELKLVFPYGFEDQALRQCVTLIKNSLGDKVYAVDGFGDSAKTLASHVDRLMQQQQQTLSLIETVSQGEFARQCQPNWLLSSLVKPSLLLGGQPINPVAVDIEECLKKLMLDAGSSISMLQMVEEESEQRIKLHSFLASKDGLLHNARHLFGRAERQQIIAASTGLNLLRKHLEG